MKHILILSEQPILIQRLTADLSGLNYSILNQSHLEPDIDDIRRKEPLLILFDLTGIDEITSQVYQGIKNNPKLESFKPPIIVLATESDLSRIPVVLEFDDLLLVPYKIDELHFRINHSLYQTGKATPEQIIKIADLAIYPTRYELYVKGMQVELTFKEYELLKYLATHRGRAFNRETLLKIIWGYDYYGGTRTVDVHIRRIRAKINDEQEEYIKTVRGVGYMFVE
jgi:DNA-binding response OmpR family regulator